MPRFVRFNPPRWIRRLLGSYADDRRGATAVEFAMVSVPFFGLLFAIFQTSYLFLTQQAVDSAATNAGRNIMTGQSMSNNYSTVSTFRTNVICPTLPSFLTCANLIIDVRPANTWSAANTAQDFLNTTPQYCIGNPGSIVIVRIIYPVPAFFSIMTLNNTLNNAGSISKNTTGQSLYGSNMVYPIMGVAAVQNEPFTAGAGGPGC